MTQIWAPASNVCDSVSLGSLVSFFSSYYLMLIWGSHLEKQCFRVHDDFAKFAITISSHKRSMKDAVLGFLDFVASPLSCHMFI